MTILPKQNLLILGASGTLAHAVLVYMEHHRENFGSLTLLDQRDFPENPYVSPDRLNADFVKLRLGKETKEEFMALLRNRSIELVLDLSDADTETVAETVFQYENASYICCAFCTSSTLPLAESVTEWVGKEHDSKKPHIFFTGMNPGSVNVWATIGMERHGLPKDITEFEYDTSRFLRAHREKMATWCIPEFIVEMVTDPAEWMLGRDKIRNGYPNGLYHRQDMESLLAPVMPLKQYPSGCIVGHEECVTLANKYDVPCKFVYSVNLETMEHLKNIYEQKGKLTEEDLVLGNNYSDPLVGADNIGMRLEYDDQCVYYFNSAQNDLLKETSGTDYQVAIGVYAALFTLLQSQLQPGIHFTEDLLQTYFPKFLTDNMMIREFVFSKGTDNALTQVSYDPHVSYGTGPFIKL